MRRTILTLALALMAAVLAGCGDDGDELMACSEMWGGAVVIEEGSNDQPCDDDGELTFVGNAIFDCSDGRTLAWNDYGWGYYGEAWTAHEEGAERTAPADAREECHS